MKQKRVVVGMGSSKWEIEKVLRTLDLRKEDIWG